MEHGTLWLWSDRLIGHTLRHDGLAGTILEGTVEGRKKKGRQTLEYVK